MAALIKRLFDIADKLYRLVFSTSMTPAIRQFLINLWWSFLGGGVLSAVFLLTSILAGRIMGPQDYGKFNLGYSLAQVYLIFVYLGLHIAIVRSLASQTNQKEQSKIISSTSLFILAALFIFSFFYLLVYQSVARRFAIEEVLLFAALIFTVSLTAKSLFDNIARGLKQFRLQFNSRIIESVLIVVTFSSFFFFFNRNQYTDYLYVLTIGALVAALYYFWQLKDRFFRFDWSILRQLLGEAKFYFITTIFGSLFVFIDKLVIARFLQFEQLGLYSAYYNASIMLVAQVSLLFINVFLPTIAGIAPKLVIQKIDRLFYRTSPAIFLLIALFVTGVLKLFGERYQLNFSYVVSFAAVAALQIFIEIYNVYIINLSTDAYKKFTLYGNAVTAAAILLYLPMIKYGLVSLQNILYLYLLSAVAIFVIQKLIIRNFSAGHAKQ